MAKPHVLMWSALLVAIGGAPSIPCQDRPVVLPNGEIGIRNLAERKDTGESRLTSIGAH